MLEGLIPDKITRIQKADILIFDGMALVQSLLPHFEHLIFRNMADMFFKHIFQIARNITDVKTVHVLFDRYSKGSLKMQTRNERGDSSTKEHCIFMEISNHFFQWAQTRIYSLHITLITLLNNQLVNLEQVKLYIAVMVQRIHAGL